MFLARKYQKDFKVGKKNCAGLLKNDSLAIRFYSISFGLIIKSFELGLWPLIDRKSIFRCIGIG
jgi:hypothetical protein